MSKIDLLPCPFCGNLEALKMQTVPSEYGVLCDTVYGGCGASTGWNHRTPEDAAEAWNTRASGWIPCSERMPERDGFYLAYFTFASGGRAFDIVYFNVGAPIMNAITHWMPLPEPPKGV